MFAVAPQSWYPPLESIGWCWWWCCSVVVDLVGLSRWRVQAWPAGFCAALWSFQRVSPGGALVFVMPATLLHKTEKKKYLPFYVYENYWQSSMWKYQKPVLYCLVAKRLVGCLMRNLLTHTHKDTRRCVTCQSTTKHACTVITNSITSLHTIVESTVIHFDVTVAVVSCDISSLCLPRSIEHFIVVVRWAWLLSSTKAAAWKMIIRTYLCQTKVLTPRQRGLVHKTKTRIKG